MEGEKIGGNDHGGREIKRERKKEREVGTQLPEL